MSRYGQGKMVLARQAMAAGMVDELSRFEPLVARLAVDAGSPRAFISVKENPMAQPTVTNTGATTNGVTSTTNTSPAQPPTPPEPAAAPTENVAASPFLSAATVSLERQRISAILTCPEADGREGLAQMLALETNESVEVARRILNASPKATAAAPAPAPNALAVEMSKLKNPQVGPAGDGGANDDSPAAEASRVLAFANPARRLSTAS